MKKLRTFIESVFDDNYDNVAAVQSFREIEDWDSLKYVKLVVAIQAEFGVELDSDEIQKVTSVSAIEEILKSKGVDL